MARCASARAGQSSPPPIRLSHRVAPALRCLRTDRWSGICMLSTKQQVPQRFAKATSERIQSGLPSPLRPRPSEIDRSDVRAKRAAHVTRCHPPQPPHGYKTHLSGAFPLTGAPADAGGARRFFATTGAMAYVSAPPIGRRRLCAPRPPAWPIAPDSIRARDEARESAQRSRVERWPRSKVHDDRLGEPSAHSTIVETPGPRRESREPRRPAKGRPGVIGHRQASVAGR